MTLIIDPVLSVGERRIVRPEMRLYDAEFAALQDYIDAWKLTRRHLPPNEIRWPEIVPITYVKVMEVVPYRITARYAGESFEFDRIKSMATATYKVVRSTKNITGHVGLLREDGEKFFSVEWPASKPFHDAFGTLGDRDGKTHEKMYVRAVEVDGQYKVMGILDDQDW